MLLCVADGVSSADNAEGASAAAVAAALELFAAGPGQAPSVVDEARNCVEAAAAAVLRVPRFGDDPDLDPPETTVALAVVRGVAAGIAWVGDSRAYRLDAGGATLLTRDDSWAWEAVARGAMSRAAAARDPRAHAITQCLGMPLDEIEIHALSAEMPAGASLLLCTTACGTIMTTRARSGRPTPTRPRAAPTPRSSAAASSQRRTAWAGATTSRWRC